MTSEALDFSRAATAPGRYELVPGGEYLLSQVDVIHSREGGLVDCYVPTELIDHEEVPVKKEWAQSLASQMKAIAEVEGGTGQISPIILGMIAGEKKFKIIDGFHRDAALAINGEPIVFSTVKHTDWDGLYDVRIFTAKDHAHVRFSRVVQWIREVWEYSGLSDRLTIEQAILLYRFDSNGAKLGLSPGDVSASNAWVQRKEEQWSMAAMTIHSHLKVAEDVDPKLVHSTREKNRGDVLEAPTQAILKIFSDTLPLKFDLQNAVMDVAMQRNLKGPEVQALCLAVKACPDILSANVVIGDIDWTDLQPAYKETKSRALRRAHDPRYKGAAVLNKTLNEVDDVMDRTVQITDRGEEITDEMIEKLDEAKQRADRLIIELGKLSHKLTELIDRGALPILSDKAGTYVSALEEEVREPQNIVNDTADVLGIEHGASMDDRVEGLVSYLMGKSDLPPEYSRKDMQKAWSIVEASKDKPGDWRSRFKAAQPKILKAQHGAKLDI